jgi:hypothetical protein
MQSIVTLLACGVVVGVVLARIDVENACWIAELSGIEMKLR